MFVYDVYWQVLTQMELQLHPAEIVQAVHVALAGEVTYLRAICYGMKTPVELFTDALDDYLAEPISPVPRCANQFDIATTMRSQCLYTMHMPAYPSTAAQDEWHVETYQQFTGVEVKPIVTQNLGGSATLGLGLVLGLGLEGHPSPHRK